MRRVLEITYIIVALVPTAWLALVIATTPGSLVSGVVIGAVLPLLALISLLLALAGLGLIWLARRRGERIWPLVLGVLIASPLAVLVGWAWLFG